MVRICGHNTNVPRNDIHSMGTHIFIDGYNFLWASGEHRPEAIHNFQEARDHMIQRLAGHPRLARHQVNIVFDAHKTETDWTTSETTGGIEVVYSRRGQEADDVLKDYAREFREAAVIVSSDREVARYAEKKGCGVLGAGTFERVLNEGIPDEDEEDEPPRPTKKGPSRRDPKARRKALAKLR
jgi:predicted RNA-binding protein with PIN domain